MMQIAFLMLRCAWRCAKRRLISSLFRLVNLRLNFVIDLEARTTPSESSKEIGGNQWKKRKICKDM